MLTFKNQHFYTLMTNCLKGKSKIIPFTRAWKTTKYLEVNVTKEVKELQDTEERNGRKYK